MSVYQNMVDSIIFDESKHSMHFIPFHWKKSSVVVLNTTPFCVACSDNDDTLFVGNCNFASPG